jgi:hypothetical protein
MPWKLTDDWDREAPIDAERHPSGEPCPECGELEPWHWPSCSELTREAL